MADVIKNIKLGDTTYPVEDAIARANASEAISTANIAKSTADTALDTANDKISANYESSTATLVLS